MNSSLAKNGQLTNHVEETAAPSDSTAASNDVSAAQASIVRASLPSPLPEHSARLPTHLEPLADRARVYDEAASSANTRRAYAADWKHFSACCRR